MGAMEEGGGRIAGKWIDGVQKDMDKYGFQLEYGADIEKWGTVIKGVTRSIGKLCNALNICHFSL